METANNGFLSQAPQGVKKLSQSLTLKALVIVFLSLILLIPSFMIMGLISERQRQSRDTIYEINEKWSLAQTVCPPVLVIPYTEIGDDQKTYVYEHELFIAPENAETKVTLFPEERHRSIYKSIVYKSDIHIDGQFASIRGLEIENSIMHPGKAYILLGLSDLRGICEEIDFRFNGSKLPSEAAVHGLGEMNSMKIPVGEILAAAPTDNVTFECNLKLKGSSCISFIPVAKTSKVSVSGNWSDPGFIGSFLPEYSIDEKAGHFTADWHVLSFNRNIPETWSDNSIHNLTNNSFGVNLVDMVDQYQQNMRSAKYALMFILLTFVVFFFVEILTKRRIHPIQYLLVGVALILFYSLLLSLSEQIGFAIAYFIASVATITLITAYAHSIFRDRKPTAILAAILTGLYLFLYTVLQLEDIALLIGSIGMFLILGVIMYVSRKISWYKE